MPNISDIRKEIKKHANPEKAKFIAGYFKTGKGQYGEGDVFLGLTVPESRKIAVKFKDLSLGDVEELLKSSIHEERLIALLLLVHNFKDKSKQKEILDFYLANTQRINNWDLVDLSAPNIVGEYLFAKKGERSILYNLTRSNSLWERRIAVVATYSFIKNNEFEDTLEISKTLLNDKHDLIHKSVGWMLREVGKRNKKVLEAFLAKYSKDMARTTLRYSIEKFPESERKKWMGR